MDARLGIWTGEGVFSGGDAGGASEPRERFFREIMPFRKPGPSVSNPFHFVFVSLYVYSD